MLGVGAGVWLPVGLPGGVPAAKRTARTALCAAVQVVTLAPPE
jgi:hypothetical protein